MKIMFVYRAVDDEALLAKEEAEHTQVNFIRCIGIGLSDNAGTVFTKLNLVVSVSTV
jgi:hypothetical protein